jgi:hypothetical protein
MRLSLLAVIAALAPMIISLAGCNTLVQDNYQKIYVRTPGVDNASCDLYTRKNYYAVVTAREVVVERSKLPLTVICDKSGYYKASVIVRSELAMPGMPLNLLNGFVPGASYDVASGSIYNYPDTITVILLPMPPQQLPPEDAPYVLEKKPEPVKAVKPVASSAADKTISNSAKK